MPYISGYKLRLHYLYKLLHNYINSSAQECKWQQNREGYRYHEHEAQIWETAQG